jgi:hemerythrin
MPTLSWSDTLLLDFALTDQMHHDFVNMLADVENCPDTDLARQWEILTSRAQALLRREDGWTVSTQFSFGQKHVLEHRAALNVMRQGLGLARRGESIQVRDMAAELARWFANHIQSMDAALDLHLRGQSESQKLRADI